MTDISIMRILLPPDDNTSDIKLRILLENAEKTLLDYMGRDKLPERLNDMVVQLALIIYNRLGNEGEIKRTEGDISVAFGSLITDDMKARLRNYPRKVGALNADDTKTS